MRSLSWSAGSSDPVFALINRKATLGVTGQLQVRAHIDLAVYHLDVDSTYPPGEAARKGSTVRRFKGNVVGFITS